MHWEALKQCKAHLDNLDDYDNIFLHVYAPTLVEYAKWVLNSARKQGFDRLYFLARDSWLPYHIAKRINEVKGYGLDIRYIYVSRFTLRNAEYSFIGKKALETICVGGIDINFRKLMGRIRLTDDEIIQVAEEIDFADRIDECLSYTQVQEIKNKLYHSEKIFEYIKVHCEPFYILTEEYLRQEGLCDDCNYALVDSGWVGTTQMSLQRLVSHITGKEINLKGFYFGLYELPDDADASNYYGYYLRPHQDFNRKTHFSICLYETVVSAPGGMTVAYKSLCGRLIPIFNGVDNPNSEQMKRNLVLIEEYINNLNYDHKSFEKDEVLIIEKLLQTSMARPTRDEASTMGALQFCDDVLESGMQNIARKWTYKELVKQNFVLKILFKFFNSKVKLHESGWPEGSIVNLCGEGITGKFALMNERAYKRGMYLRKARNAS